MNEISLPSHSCYISRTYISRTYFDSGGLQHARARAHYQTLSAECFVACTQPQGRLQFQMIGPAPNRSPDGNIDSRSRLQNKLAIASEEYYAQFTQCFYTRDVGVEARTMLLRGAARLVGGPRGATGQNQHQLSHSLSHFNRGIPHCGLVTYPPEL